MGLKIKKGNTELDLKPGTRITRERQSPFFRKEEVPPEISYPFTMPPTDNNLKELGYPDHLPADKTQRSDILLIDDGMPITAGKLQTEYLDTNLRRSNVGSISAFVLSNFSEFLQRIKNKKLKDLTLGGIRTFAWDGYNASSGTGFWKHCHDTWTYTDSDDGDYVFSPIKNEGYLGNATWMNKIKSVASDHVELDELGNSRSLCPILFIVPILKWIFEEHGYAVSGEILEDAQFKKTIIPSFFGVHWCSSSFDSADPPNETVTPLANITIDLKEHVPPEWTIAKFLIELQSKIPIGYDIDDRKKECRIVLLSDLTPALAKDRSSEIASSLRIILEKEQPVYAFENSFDSNDEYEADFDLSTWDYQGEALTVSTLSPGQCYLSTANNKYYGVPITEPAPTTPIFVGHNVAGYKPNNATDTIGSAMAPMPYEDIEVDTDPSWGVVAYPIPICKQEGNWKGKSGDFVPWDVRLLFWYGAVNFVNDLLPYAVPFAHHHIYYQSGSPVGDWSWAYKCGEFGLYDKFWKHWLKTFANIESVQGIWQPSLVDYLQHSWSEPLLLNNTPYLLTNITEILPMNGKVKVAFKARRMGRNDLIAVVIGGGGSGGGGTTYIFLKMVWENLTGPTETVTDAWMGSIHYTDAVIGNLVVYAFSDAAGTAPVNPGILQFNLKVSWTVDGVAQSSAVSPWSLSGQRTVIDPGWANVVNGEAIAVKSGNRIYAPAGAADFTFTIDPGSGYQVI